MTTKSLSIFEKYELHRQRYSPGTRWRTKGSNTIEELEIVNPSDFSDSDFYYAFKSYGGQIAHFRVLDSLNAYGDCRLTGKGRLVKWSSEYMENNYEPVIQ